MAFPFIYILGIAHALTREQKKIRKNVEIEVDQGTINLSLWP